MQRCSWACANGRAFEPTETCVFRAVCSHDAHKLLIDSRLVDSHLRRASYIKLPVMQANVLRSPRSVMPKWNRAPVFQDLSCTRARTAPRRQRPLFRLRLSLKPGLRAVAPDKVESLTWLFDIPAMMAYGRGMIGIFVDVYVYRRTGRLHAGIPFMSLTHRDSETRVYPRDVGVRSWCEWYICGCLCILPTGAVACRHPVYSPHSPRLGDQRLFQKPIRRDLRLRDKRLLQNQALGYLRLGDQRLGDLRLRDRRPETAERARWVRRRVACSPSRTRRLQVLLAIMCACERLGDLRLRDKRPETRDSSKTKTRRPETRRLGDQRLLQDLAQRHHRAIANPEEFACAASPQGSLPREAGDAETRDSEKETPPRPVTRRPEMPGGPGMRESPLGDRQSEFTAPRPRRREGWDGGLTTTQLWQRWHCRRLGVVARRSGSRRWLNTRSAHRQVVDIRVHQCRKPESFGSFLEARRRCGHSGPWRQ